MSTLNPYRDEDERRRQQRVIEREFDKVVRFLKKEHLKVIAYFQDSRHQRMSVHKLSLELTYAFGMAPLGGIMDYMYNDLEVKVRALLNISAEDRVHVDLSFELPSSKALLEI